MSKIGLVDIGSNTVRLVIYQIAKNLQYHILLDTKESIRLRNHVEDNSLTEQGVQKLLTILKSYQTMAQEYDLSTFYLFATQTIRMVVNKNDVLDEVKQQLGLNITILSQDEESLVGLTGMLAYLPNQQDGVYVDLGGGSMEIVHYEKGKAIHFHSFDFGSIVIRNMLSHAIPSTDEISSLHTFLNNKWKELPWLHNLNLPLIVVGESSLHVVRMDSFLTKRLEPLHGYQLDFENLQRIRKMLMLLPIEEIENIDGMTSSRADIIIPSIYVFECLYEYTNAKYYCYSQTGLREGVLLKIVGG
jgi:exopolyphosphatase/guanosine-5'-triphosphate,3'-diphosphate pyrophosphatase